MTARPLLLIALVFLTACPSSYMPRRSPRIALVQTGAGPTLVRDGQQFPMGMWGDGLSAAVQRSARASEHAQAYHDNVWGGFLLGIGSSIPIGVGTGLVVVNASDRRAEAQDTAIAWSVLGVGIIAYVASIAMLSSAPAQMHDAINVYNDWVDAGMPAEATPVGD